MSNRHQRRAELADFKREASQSLLTYLVEPNDPALDRMPLLRAAADNWLDALSVRVRHCIICNVWLVNPQHVGALLLSTPATSKPTSAGTAAVCRTCWDADLPVDVLERACASVLQSAVPNGRFEPHQDARR
jgi:hypothetical protein